MVGTLNPPAGTGARRLLVVAGEASGDVHAAALVRALRERADVDVCGVAGPRMRAAGVRAIVEQERLAVIGFSGVLAKLPVLFGARDAILREAAAFRPHAIVLVDYPGFNLRLGPQLERFGAKRFYYIAPQVWAWHPERAHEMARWVDRLAVVFPFEEAIFRDAGVDTRFVGHPLLDALEPECDETALRAELGVPPGARLVGLLPGSRRGELKAHLATLLEAGRELVRRGSGVVPVVALAEGFRPEDWPFARYPEVKVTRGRTRAVQRFAACCAVASGTATLETALFGTPLAIVYRVGAINWAIARRVVKLPRIGLPNIVAGHEVAPELLQGDFTATRVADTLGAWLADDAELARRRDALRVVRERLGGPGASTRAADALLELLA
ncbi:MAG: lipid-A-disaccharide synthase [Candidatus Eisenbacteria bacterium]